MFSDPPDLLIEKLSSLSESQLKALWQKSFSRPSSPRLRRELMLPILAFRLQEISHGGPYSPRLQGRESLRANWNELE